MSLIYFFDVGNTTGKFWRESNGSVMAKAVLLHERSMAKLISELPSAFDASPDGLYGLFVLDDQAAQEFELKCRERWGRCPSFAHSQTCFKGTKNGYRAPELLGIDRWLGIIGASTRAENVCVVSCGTALTIDVLKHEAHGGGFILPGLNLMGECLCKNTAGVRFNGQGLESLGLGRSTSEAVLNGALMAAVSVIERVVSEFEISKLVLTGGDADRVSPFLGTPHVVEPDLLLGGLRKYFAK